MQPHQEEGEGSTERKGKDRLEDKEGRGVIWAGVN